MGVMKLATAGCLGVCRNRGWMRRCEPSSNAQPPDGVVLSPITALAAFQPLCLLTPAFHQDIIAIAQSAFIYYLLLSLVQACHVAGCATTRFELSILPKPN